MAMLSSALASPASFKIGSSQQWQTKPARPNLNDCPKASASTCGGRSKQPAMLAWLPRSRLVGRVQRECPSRKTSASPCCRGPFDAVPRDASYFDDVMLTCPSLFTSRFLSSSRRGAVGQTLTGERACRLQQSQTLTDGLQRASRVQSR